jgi:hypothetical protein
MKPSFHVVVDNGHFFKHLIDFITLCVFPKTRCWLRFDHDGIKITHSAEKQDGVQFYINLLLERCNFSSFQLNSPVELQLEPKQLQKICRNVKKKDQLILSFKDAKFLLTVRSTEGIGKEEEKEIPFLSFFEKDEATFDQIDIDFSQVPFTLDTVEIQNLKKAVGIKKEVVELKVHGDKFLQFSTLSHGIAPMTIKYGIYERSEATSTNFTQIFLSGNIINMLAKLLNLSRKIKFYEKLTQSQAYSMLKISSMIDIPQYLGKIDLYIYTSNTLEEI